MPGSQRDALRNIGARVAANERAAAGYPSGFTGRQTLRYGHVTEVRLAGMVVSGYDVELEQADGSPGEEYEAVLAKPGTDSLEVGDGVWLLFDRPEEDPTIVAAGAGGGPGGETVYRTVITGWLGFLAE